MNKNVKKDKITHFCRIQPFNSEKMRKIQLNQGIKTLER